MIRYYRIEAWRAWFYFGIAQWTIASIAAIVALASQYPVSVLWIPGIFAFILGGTKSLHNGWTIDLPPEKPFGERA
jgi:hypothetical protein